MNVAVYYRVSTRGQADDDKHGLPVQREAVEAYCAEHGHSIVATYEDAGYSGAMLERPALGELLNGSGFDAVIVYRWDRLARDQMLDGYIRYALKRNGVEVLSATETNGIDSLSKLTQQILAAVAEYERWVIAQRLLSGRKAKRRKGGYIGGCAPVGYRPDNNGSLTVVADEMRALEIAKRLRSSDMPYRAIAAALNAAGMRSRSGKEWQASTVHSMLRKNQQASAA